MMCMIKKENYHHYIVTIRITIVVCLILSVRSANADHFTLTLAHVNDTHGHIQPTAVGLVINGVQTYMEVGGYPRLVTKINQLRSTKNNFLFLHAGDMFQGTLYFTKYKGMADLEFFNLMGLDALCPGNHEFDLGAETLLNFINKADFPVLSANINIKNESALKGKIIPYSIKKIGSENVGIIGLTTPETPFISKPDPSIQFYDPVIPLQNAIDDLERQGVDKIIVLSHLGFEKDKELAESVKGIDIIVGGHSHTLLGDYKRYGLDSDGDYPHVCNDKAGERVLIVQAWEWGKILGCIDVEFDEKGKIVRYDGTPRMLVGVDFKQRRSDGKNIATDNQTRISILNIIKISSVMEIVEEDRAARERLQQYAEPIEALYKQIIASVEEDLSHRRRPTLQSITGAGAETSTVAPIIADAMLWKANRSGINVTIAIINAGAISGGMLRGNITVGQSYDLLPFSNTLVVIELSGREIANALENGVARAFSRAGGSGSFPYVSGLCYTIDRGRAKKRYVHDIMVKSNAGVWDHISNQNTYKVIVNSFLARGGDGYTILADASGYRYDTGFIETEVFMEFAKAAGILKRHSERRIIVTGK